MMSDKKAPLDNRLPGVEPIPEPDRPDHASTDMLDDVVTGILENKNEDELKQTDSSSSSNEKPPSE